MSMGRMISMRSGRNSRSDRNNSPRNEFGENSGGRYESPRNESADGVYDYDRYRRSDGRSTSEPRNESNIGMYNAFYDRNGRRHYDNGRYAPMRNSYDGGAYNMMIGFGDREGEEMRRQEREMMRGNGSMRNFFPETVYDHEGYSEEEQRRMKERQKRRELGHAALYEGEDGEYYFKGKFGGMDGFPRSGENMIEQLRMMLPRHMTREMAEKWTRDMENEDGSRGPHWSMEQIEQLKQQKKELQEFDTPTLYAVLNMFYSDYCKVAKKYNVNNMDYYIDLAKAWLEDEDAGAGKQKTVLYYLCIAQ